MGDFERQVELQALMAERDGNGRREQLAVDDRPRPQCSRWSSSRGWPSESGR